MAELRFSALREVFNREPVAVKVPSPVISDYFQLQRVAVFDDMQIRPVISV